MIRRCLPPLAAVAALSLLLGLANLARFGAVAQDLLPTPSGQLGGAPPLETAPPAPDESPPPTAEGTSWDVPDASECEVEPRSIDELLAVGTPPAPIVAGDGKPTVFAGGGPATGEDEVGIVLSVREIVACSNAGALLRVWALYSDRFILGGDADVFVAADQRGGRLSPEVLEELVMDAAAREDPMPEVHAIRRLAGGRVVALVVAPPGASLMAFGSEATVLDVAFVWLDGRWRVDEAHVVRRG